MVVVVIPEIATLENYYKTVKDLIITSESIKNIFECVN